MPTIGRIVIYVMPETSPVSGEFRPAIVTKVWSERVVNLRVIYDPNDRSQLTAQDQSSVELCDAANPEMRKWCWPQRA